MPELIDRQALIKDMCDNKTEEKCPCYPNCYPCDFSEVRRIIDKQPTIEPEVRHGRWIYRSDDAASCYCSECNEEALTASYERNCIESDFCPSCGARMDAEDINVLTKDGGADNG